MTKKIQKSAVLMALALGLFFIASAPDVMAQGRCNNRRGGYQSTNYGNYGQGAYYQDDGVYQNRRARRNSNYDYNDGYYNDEATTGKAVGRTAIGAGIGAAGGALIGGKKGALIGAGIGAAGGYLYHRNKVNNQRDRYYRY